MLTEVQYRTFDELLDSVKLDLKTFDLEGMIDTQQLIKVAMKVNYELGLKINPSRSKPIEICKGKGKLPSDFHVLNFALLCDGRTASYDEGERTFTRGLLENIRLFQQVLSAGTVNQFTATMDIVPGTNILSHPLGTKNVLVQAIAPDDTILSFEFRTPTSERIEIISVATATVANVKVIIMGSKDILPADPFAELLIDSSSGNPFLKYDYNNLRYEYKQLIPMKIEKSKSVSVDCMNLNSSSWHTGVLKNGFFVTNFDEGMVFINYQSLMEDDMGNLLVMDHPMVNEYYEYALKQRIYENLYMGGENVLNYLQLVEQRLRAARNNAISFMNTPDFNEMRKVWEMNRKAQSHKYIDMFKNYPNV